jgi:hypothetical protein
MSVRDQLKLPGVQLPEATAKRFSPKPDCSLSRHCLKKQTVNEMQMMALLVRQGRTLER